MVATLIFFILLVAPSITEAQSAECPSGQLAFPGAEGFGRCTEGGRSGVIIDVTNLNDSGPGSLRECAQVRSGRRICRFRVSGTIDLSSLQEIEIVNPYVSIDGSTAPLGGIALKNAGISVKANHVILRHLRIRPGSRRTFELGRNANGITIRSNEGVPIHHVFVDHCSVSWGTDDLINTVFGSDYVTVQWSILSEGLQCLPSCGSKGFLHGYGAQHTSVHHNLSAHNWTRWPEVTGGGSSTTGYLDWVNNVNYNGNGSDTIIDPHANVGGPLHMNIVGNYWKHGPNTFNKTKPSVRALGGLAYSSQGRLFVHDNYGWGWTENTSDGSAMTWGVATPDRNIVWADNGGIPYADVRHPFPSVTTYSSVENLEMVLSGAGAFPRDSVDARIVDEVRKGTGRWIKDPSEVGGWPSLTQGSGDTTPPNPPTSLRIGS